MCAGCVEVDPRCLAFAEKRVRGSSKRKTSSPTRQAKRKRLSESDKGAQAASASASVWTSVELAFLSRGQGIFGNVDFCSISEFIGSKTCLEVMQWLSTRMLLIVFRYTITLYVCLARVLSRNRLKKSSSRPRKRRKRSKCA